MLSVCVSVCLKKADLVIILDASGSVGKANWKKQVDFAISLVSRLNIGTNHVQVALITFSDKETIIFHLNTHKDISKVRTDLTT